MSRPLLNGARMREGMSGVRGAAITTALAATAAGEKAFNNKALELFSLRTETAPGSFVRSHSRTTPPPPASRNRKVGISRDRESNEEFACTLFPHDATATHLVLFSVLTPRPAARKLNYGKYYMRLRLNI